MTQMPLLSLMIWMPIVGGLLTFCFNFNLPEKWVKTFAFFVTFVILLLSIPLLTGFNTQTFEMQWKEFITWIPNFGIYYSLGVDGFSLPLLLLTNLMTLIVVLASFKSVHKKIPAYLCLFLVMQGLMNGAFLALDGILFYVFWEGMLIPMFLIIGIWGSQNRIYATLKFFLYTFLGSVLLLIALIYLHLKAIETGLANHQIFDILAFHSLPLSFEAQRWLFLAFLLAFAVKIPMWPIHTWLPDAHTEAPAGGSVILAAILLKMGGYGFLRFILPITPDASNSFAWPMIILSLIAIVYISLVTVVQKDMKKLIAYSSISHMGFVTLGIFISFLILLNTQDPGSASRGVEGAMVQMISHGLISGALFLCIGVLYDRLHSRLIKEYGGVVNSMPIFASFFMLFAMANVGLPGTSGFVGEFLVIVSTFQANFWVAVLSSSILVLGAAYTLWMVKRVIFGMPAGPKITALSDIDGIEKIIFLILGLLVLVLGIWPAPLLDLMQASSQHLIQQLLQSKY